MAFIYNILIKLADGALRAISPFNSKIKSGVIGRQNTFQTLKTTLQKTDKTLWFHCASLGEYEQGLPVFTKLRTHYPKHKIVLSFFSPSGYEIRKNSPIADVVIYLPIDTKKNAKTFLDLVNPELTIFVKYDIWPNFLNEVKKRKLRAILISAAFRKNQSYFKFYGRNLRNALFAFEHIFTQNESSKTLLESIQYNSVSVSGDTRFDRVTSQLELDNNLDFIETFKDYKLCVVAGSTWPEGEKLLTNYINSRPLDYVKFIIAPHNIKAPQINQLQQNLKVNSVLFSEKENKNLKAAQVFIVNTIGILTKIYSYADIAYVGGALGTTGLHNTLEPAVFGIPIIIGNNHEKFPEAQAMINAKGLFSIEKQQEFNTILDKLIEDSDFREQSGQNNSSFIKKNKGAVIQILDYLRI
ncbi:3-deoxy-D-manno-octulosonic acid transferase [Algibacter lectus]|uniref:3-deoxy-D-manno-octulosonic acid transferase n=1 Tax=Algibacter lectus TaxID=221126 RepID=A0A090VCK2_9FLAO|nr:glycosyltransferase N-terminal domain-containing protein [Algibacter lectus]MDO7137834.1 glycosyltransferase N-terminal domain-containing protein [Algibacter lectus]GAL62490.1 lipid IVA 3-deoxy-D-manno-octulosonic acid transferase [Algibacter lectus]SFD35755.1 3-deoxy-D-manno-octulosonic-acid transferase [Algibacter lectus]